MVDKDGAPFLEAVLRRRHHIVAAASARIPEVGCVVVRRDFFIAEMPGW
ncbi:MAG TPA: hypothetical protein VID03_00310 [Acidimicrobiia bacterium]